MRMLVIRLVRCARAQSLGFVALLIALSGTSYAALSLPRDSVGTKQIRAGGVRNSDVAVGSLRFDRLKRESVPGGTAIVRSALLASGAPIIYGTVMCKTDEVATGGGFSNPGSFDGPNGYEIVTDAPNFNKTTNLATGWSVVARRGTASVSDTPSVYVVCYSASRE